MRKIDSIFIHCSFTPADMDIGVKEIRDWHVNGNGWSDIGYHRVIRRNGKTQTGRGLARMGAHTRGYNATSVGICLVGGKGVRGRPMFNYTHEQIIELKAQVDALCSRFGLDYRHVHGHNEVSSKACPCFVVDALFERSEVLMPRRDPNDAEGF